jgi:predicted kinase
MEPGEQDTPQQTSNKRIRLVRPSVVILCGPAACGKSTFAERHFRPTQIISSDWARARVCDDERDQRYSAQAFALVHFLIEQRLELNRLCVVDSTALTAQARRELLELARKHQVPSFVLLFNVPLEKCVERDQKRERTVGRAVIERQYQAFEQVKAGIKQEGFDKVIELPDENLDCAEIETLFRPVARPPARPVRPNQQTAPRLPQRSGNSASAPPETRLRVPRAAPNRSPAGASRPPAGTAGQSPLPHPARPAVASADVPRTPGQPATPPQATEPAPSTSHQGPEPETTSSDPHGEQEQGPSTT